MKRPLRRQWYDAVDAQNAANQLLAPKSAGLAGGYLERGRGQSLGALAAIENLKFAAILLRCCEANLCSTPRKERDVLGSGVSLGEKNPAWARNNLWRGGQSAALAGRSASGGVRDGGHAQRTRYSVASRARSRRTDSPSRALRREAAAAASNRRRRARYHNRYGGLRLVVSQIQNRQNGEAQTRKAALMALPLQSIVI